MSEEVDGRHRSTGRGRYLALRTAAPRHAPATGTGPRRWPWAVVAAALLALAATVPLLLRDPGTPQAAVPLPAVSIPAPAVTAEPAPAGSRHLRAVAPARKLSATPSASASRTTTPTAAPVLLGPARAAELPGLLTSYCRATAGRFTLAVSTNGGWACGRRARDPVPIDMDAMCRWRYGRTAWADLPDDTDATGWRCYRDGP